MDTPTTVHWTDAEWTTFFESYMSVLESETLDGSFRAIVLRALNLAVAQPNMRYRSAPSIAYSDIFVQRCKDLNLPHSLEGAYLYRHGGTKAQAELPINVKPPEVPVEKEKVANGQRVIRRWSKQECAAVAKAFVLLKLEDVSQTDQNVMTLAQKVAFKDRPERIRTNYSALLTLSSKGYIRDAQENLKTAAPAAPTPVSENVIPIRVQAEAVKPDVVAEAVKPRKMPSVAKFKAIISQVISDMLLDPTNKILLKLEQLHNRIDAVGRQAGMAISLGQKNTELLVELGTVLDDKVSDVLDAVEGLYPEEESMDKVGSRDEEDEDTWGEDADEDDEDDDDEDDTPVVKSRTKRK